MWNSRIASVRSSTFLKQCRAPQLSLNNGLTSLNRNLWNGSNSRSNACFTALAARLLRAFDRNLKSMFKIGKSTRNSIFGTLLENRLIQVMLVDFGRTVTRNRDMLLSATCLSVYNWEENSSSDEHIEGLSCDVDFISQLTLETLTCKNCNQRLKIDRKVPDVTYCTCSDSKPSSSEVDGWKPFIERPNTLVWRKEHEAYKGLYAYKMYARFENVTAMDFLRVQLDTNFRKQWDTSATELRVIEEDREASRDLVYWEMRWPKPFASRDYVFERKLTFIPKSNVCIVSSIATSHPAIPVNKSMHRVTEYWSFMVVKPFTDFDKPGTEFVLTYFDNPGLSIPSSVSTWVAMTGLPNFVSKLSEAASKVTDLVGPEPALLSCLRAQMATHRGNILTATETEEALTIQLPAGDGTASSENAVTIREEKSSLTIVENSPPEVENQFVAPCPTSPESETLLGQSSINADPVSQESNDSLGASVKMTSTVPTSPTAHSCCSSDNPQFLARSPVYA